MGGRALAPPAPAAKSRDSPTRAASRPSTSRAGLLELRPARIAPTAAPAMKAVMIRPICW